MFKKVLSSKLFDTHERVPASNSGPPSNHHIGSTITEVGGIDIVAGDELRTNYVANPLEAQPMAIWHFRSYATSFSVDGEGVFPRGIQPLSSSLQCGLICTSAILRVQSAQLSRRDSVSKPRVARSATLGTDNSACTPTGLRRFQ